MICISLLHKVQLLKLEEIKVKVNKVKLSKKKTNIVAIFKSNITSDEYNKGHSKKL